MRTYTIKVIVNLEVKADNKRVAMKAARNWDGSKSIYSFGADSYTLQKQGKRQEVYSCVHKVKHRNLDNKI